MPSERQHPEPDNRLPPGKMASHGWPPEATHRSNIVAYLADFGWTLSDLDPDQLEMFVAARNAAQYVDALEIPIATQPSATGGATLAERETQRTLQLTTYNSDDLESRLPTDEMDVTLARSAEDLPRIFPTQWLLEELQPSMFYAKLAEWELLMPVWQRSSHKPKDSTDDSLQRELVDDAAQPDSAKQHAYVLLDTSRTMNDHDRRGTIARGLTLAILRNGYHQRAQLNLRPFTAEIGELSSGVSHDDLRAIAERVIRLPNSGQTRIQAALEQAVRDIRTSGPYWRADIVLVTDGISRLLENPLGKEKLHTFILGDLFEKEGESSTIATLKQWSTTFHRVWKNRFAGILTPTLNDLQAAHAVLEAALAEDSRGASNAEPEKLRRLIANVKRLSQDFERFQGTSMPLPPEIAELEQQLNQGERVPPSTSETAPLTQEQAMKTSGRVLWRQTRSSGGAQGTPIVRFRFWQCLRRVAVSVWTWSRERCRRLLRRRR